MKDINTILEHLIENPLYSKLKCQQCFALIKKSLPKPLQKGVQFMYIKNNTLFIALKHPLFKSELDYKLSSIKSLLSSLPPVKKSCEDYNIKTIKTFVSDFVAQPKTKLDTIPRYKELATGVFEIKSKDDDIKEGFETIKRHINNA